MPSRKKKIPKKTPRLTEKQKQFCKEYLIDLNATAAAERAGYRPAYGRQLITFSNVLDHIKTLQKKNQIKSKSKPIRCLRNMLQSLFRILHRSSVSNRARWLCAIWTTCPRQYVAVLPASSRRQTAQSRCVCTTKYRHSTALQSTWVYSMQIISRNGKLLISY